MQLIYRIAISVGLVACGGAQKGPSEPVAEAPKDEASPAAPAAAASAVPSGPSLLVGWYCPESAAGRPAVEPALALEFAWTNAKDVLARAIATRRTKRLSVLSYAGGRAGSFAVAGAATSGGTSLAIGSYSGAQPCETVDGLGQVRSRDEMCVRTTHGCSLAVGALEDAGGFKARPYEEDPETWEPVTGRACEIGRHLVIDVDGDGVAERFSLDDLIEGREPVELPLLDEGGRTCEANFASLVEDASSLVRVGVLDLDGDGRAEVIYLRNDQLYIYGAPNSPARMELLGRATLTSTPK